MKTKKRWGRKGFALFLALLLALSPAAAFAESPDAVEDSKQPQAVEETKAPEPETKAEKSQKPETKPEVTETKVPEKETEKPAEETKPATEPSAKEPQKVPASNEAPEKEPVKEQTENHNEKEQVPQVVKTFLNAVQRLADLGTMTEENAEQFTALGQAAMDAYEAVQDAGLEHYEGVQKALAALMRITDSATDGTETMAAKWHTITLVPASTNSYSSKITSAKVRVGQRVNSYEVTSVSGTTIKVKAWGDLYGDFFLPKAADLWNGAVKSDYVKWAGVGSSDKTEGASAMLPQSNASAYYYFNTAGSVGDGSGYFWNFTLKYDANGGIGAPEDQTYGTTNKYTKSHNFTIPDQVPELSGYTFKGWADSPKATSATYQPNGSCLVEQTVAGYNGGSVTKTLYAVWEPNAVEPVTPAEFNFQKVFKGLDEIPTDFSIHWSVQCGELTAEKTLTMANAVAIDKGAMSVTWKVPYYYNQGSSNGVTITENCDVNGYTYTATPSIGNASGNVIQMSIGAMASGGTRSVTNTYHQQAEPEPGSVTVEKTPVKTEYQEGDDVIWNIVVTNTGKTTMSGLSVRDYGVENVIVAGPQGVDPNSFELKPGASVTFTAVLEKAEAGKYTNKAEVQQDGKTLDEDTADTVVVPPAQPSAPTTTLAVTKAANVKTVKAGDTVVYTITVTNTGETAAKNVTVTDVLDRNLNWMRAELNGTGITPVSGVYHIGELAVGTSATLTITAQVAANVEPGTEIVNTATADNDNKPEGSKPPGDTAKVTVTAPEDPQQIKLTFVVVNGSWNDGTKETIVKPVELGENGNYTIKSDDVPKVGDKPDEGYKAGSWDDVPNGVTVTADTTYTYTYVKDEDATNPTDPTDPGDSTDPTAPTDPSDSTDPTNPSDPTDSTKPTAPGESTEPTTPTTPPAPTQPTDPVSPTEPTTPSQPTNPTVPSVPSQPTDPTGPTVPTDPTTPVDPTDPTEPSEPAGPTEPTEPTTPVIPAGPTTPADPGSPSGPDTPNTPAAPNGPAGPVGRTTAVDTVPTATPAAIPAVAALAPAAAAAVGLPDDTVPLAGQEDPELAELDDEGVPLAKGASGAWALLNFALMNLAIFECLMLLIGYFIKTKGASEEEEEEKKKLKKKGVMRIISLPIAVVSIVAFCLTEDITLPTAFVDRYTLLMAIIALVQTVAVVLSRKELKDETDDETEVKAAA